MLVRALMVVVLGFAMVSPARAQTAPAGNAHPQPQEVTDVELLSNPFGAVGPSAFKGTQEKAAFARAVDLSPLRDLAVFHSGRVKILDTLARETVRELMGRFDYQDIDVDPSDPHRSVRTKYDPLFTFMDLIIDPGYYVDRPLIHVEFLPLREAFLKRMYPDFEGDLAASPAGRQFRDGLAALGGAGRPHPSDWLARWDSLAPKFKAAPANPVETTDSERLVALVAEVRAWLLDPGNTDGLQSLRQSTFTVHDLVTRGEQREWWKRLGRLKPALMAPHLAEITDKHQFEAGFPRALSDVRGELLLYQGSWKNLVMVASDAEDKPWAHLATLPPDSPAGKAVRELGAAWKKGDAAGVNAAAKTLGAELPRINARYYPAGKRALEAAYNRAHAFEWGSWLYALALVTLLLAFGTRRRWLVWAGVGALAGALAMHGFGFIARCVIAERFAIQNQFESMTGLSLFATLVGTVIMLLRRQWLFGAAAAGVGFMILLTATQTGIPGKVVEREAPILNTSVLLKYHVTTVLVSYGLISLGFMVSLFYLGTHYMARARGHLAGPKLAAPGAGDAGGVAMADVSAEALGLGGGGEGAGTSAARVLHDLDKAQMIILQLAFWALGVGILLGAWWADHSWGRWWAFDPKELWALVTWIVYLVVIHIRFAQIKDRGLTTAWLSVLGFVVMLWTYFGVNLLLPGLHAYA
jgi:cytochrome c-type biogenesis protein CcsB